MITRVFYGSHLLINEQPKLYVCYLPPSNSTRCLDINEFLDSLLGNIYDYQHNSIIKIIGDFNIRVGTSEDFIAGVDNLPERQIIDYQTSPY